MSDLPPLDDLPRPPAPPTDDELHGVRLYSPQHLDGFGSLRPYLQVLVLELAALIMVLLLRL